MADLKTSKITRLKIGYANNESYLSESDSTALDILGDARIRGNINLYGNLNIIKNNINLFQVNQDSITIPTLNITDLNINGTSFTDIQNNINSSISNSSSAAETNAKKFASSEIVKLNKSHTDGKYISSISAPNGNGSSAAIAVNETAFDSSVSLTSLNGIQNKVITNYVDTKISDEKTARENADSNLQGKINNEKTARENADSNLQGQIDSMKSDNVPNSLANRIKNLEERRLSFRSITSAQYGDSSPWNSGKWLIMGCDRVTFKVGNTEKSYFCPCVFYGGYSGGETDRVYNHAGGWDDVYDYYGGITVNGELVSYSTTSTALSCRPIITPSSTNNCCAVDVSFLF